MRSDEERSRGDMQGIMVGTGDGERIVATTTTIARGHGLMMTTSSSMRYTV
jgi:hypothetical protein